MSLVKKKYVQYLEWGFKLAYLLLGAATFNVFLYDSPVQPFLVKLCLVLGMLTLVGRMFFLKSYFKTPNFWVLVMFCVSFLISMFVNREYGAFGADFKWLIWTGMLFFLLYVCDGDRKTETYKKEFIIFSHIMIIYSVVSSLVSVYLMFDLYHKSWYTAGGELMIAGFQWGRLWGIYTDPNYGSVFSVAAVLLCIYFCRIRGTWKKIPYILAMAADYLYIVFSDSRTAEVCMVAGVVFWILFIACGKYKTKKIFLAGLALSIIFTAVFLGGTSYIKKQYNAQIQQQINAIEAKKNQKTTNPKPNQQVGRKADLEKDVSNGRIAIWKSGLEIFQTKPVFGTGYNSFLPYVRKNLPTTYMVNNSQGEYVSLHNAYMNILVYQGIVGAAVFLLFAGLTIRCWWRGVCCLKEENREYIAVLTACTLVIGIAMVFLMEGIYTNSLGAFILWTFLGYLLQECRKEERAERKK